jgi:hypothetical protein
MKNDVYFLVGAFNGKYLILNIYRAVILCSPENGNI